MWAQLKFLSFLLRCMECRRGLAMYTLSVPPSVCLSVKRVDCDKTKKDLSRFLYQTKDHLAKFSENKNGWRGPTPST